MRAPFCTSISSLVNQQLQSAGTSALLQVGPMFGYLTVLQSWPGSCLVGKPHSRESTFAAVFASRTTEPHVNKGCPTPTRAPLSQGCASARETSRTSLVAKTELCWIQGYLNASDGCSGARFGRNVLERGSLKVMDMLGESAMGYDERTSRFFVITTQVVLCLGEWGVIKCGTQRARVHEAHT